ncbi:hypothetical protein FA95DRAFT_1614069 [Auriscalpium vulgare]|uniref:Uncharacterized protein n=1 Tax=Auriscalpium vulgare TaxID=40419 RepID=A0ACB8R151_9AGAM|nr:hypothetical protein FA95DRAFT_1614069 [Auriscalpium vulgare]
MQDKPPRPVDVLRRRTPHLFSDTKRKPPSPSRRTRRRAFLMSKYVTAGDSPAESLPTTVSSTEPVPSDSPSNVQPTAGSPGTSSQSRRLPSQLPAHPSVRGGKFPRQPTYDELAQKITNVNRELQHQKYMATTYIDITKSWEQTAEHLQNHNRWLREELSRQIEDLDRQRADSERHRADLQRLDTERVERIRAEAEEQRVAALADAKRMREEADRIRAGAEERRVAALADAEKLREELERIRAAAEEQKRLRAKDMTIEQYVIFLAACTTIAFFSVVRYLVRK